MIKVALVGRPNVGKSALFNRICAKKVAIVDDAEGVTRDRLYAPAECFGKRFEIIDTGGIAPRSEIPFQEEVRRQTEIAIEEADSLIMVVDSHAGITAYDEYVAKLLLRTQKPLCLAVNKVDHLSKEELIHQFYPLGIAKMIPVSASQGTHIAELIDAALEQIEASFVKEEDSTALKVAIIGRANVGKSTLINYLLQEERCVVSPLPGTTRDSVDVQISVEGTSFTLIDTAGIRRKSAEHDVVDKFAAIRTERAIERADVCLLLLDAQEGLTTQEKRIAELLEEKGKGCVLLLNKWDKIKGFRMEHCLKALHAEAAFLKHCPTLFISAKMGRNVVEVFPLVQKVHEQQTHRITTGQLNSFIEKALQKCHPPMLQGGKRLRIYYMAQVGIHPPHFVFFVNHPSLMTETYKQYLIHQFREHYGFAGVPLLFTLRGRASEERS